MLRLTHSRFGNGLLILALAALLVGGMAGCANLSNTAKGGAIGGGAGAAIGGVLGGRSGDAGRGAVIGGAIGAAVGAVIGRQMDKQAEELETELEGAEIVRVDDKIQITFESAILFDFAKSDLKANAKANLDNLSESMKTYDNTEVIIVGHTDSVGSDATNDRLSIERATSVVNYLATRGITSDRIFAEGRGEREPVASNDTEAGRSQNRRVELYIQVTEAARQELEAQEAQRQGQGNN